MLADGAYAAVDFSVEDQKSSSEKLSLVLDLRQSLSYDKSKNKYTLTPLLRSVSSDDAARIEGVVTVVCPLGSVAGSGRSGLPVRGYEREPGRSRWRQGGAVRHNQRGEVGDDRARVLAAILPDGDYTLAFTCNGYEDELGVDDDLRFRNVSNVRVGRGEVVLRNFN